MPARSWRSKPDILNYTVAALAVLVPLSVGVAFQDSFGAAPSLSLFVCAVMFAAWFGGTGAAIFATVLSIVAMDYFLIDPVYSFGWKTKDLPRLVLFGVAALFVVALSAAQRRSSDALRRIRDEQQAAVTELRRLNESLRDENAERKAAEEKASRAERRLQATVDTIPALVAVYLPDGIRSFVNRTWLEYAGISLEEAIGAGGKTANHPDDEGRLDAEWKASLATGEPLLVEVRIRRADGEYRWHTVRRVPLRDENGEVTRWYSIAVDVEDQKRAEDALRRSETRLANAERELRLTIDMIAAVVTCYRADGERDYVNQPWRDYTGLTVTDIQNGRWRTIVHPEDQEESEEKWNASLATGEPFQFEQRLRRADGEFRWHMVRRVPLRDDNGDVIRWYGIGSDIEDQKRAEEALRRSEADLVQTERKLQLTIDTIPVMIAVHDADGSRAFVNLPWRNYTGLTEKDIGSSNWTTIAHPDDLKAGEGQWQYGVTKPGSFQAELRLRSADGTYRWHHVHRVPLCGGDGEVVSWYAVAFDIEDRKQAESALLRSEAQLAEAKTQLQATIDTIPTLVASYLPDGSRDFVNEAWKRYTGLSEDDALGAEWSIMLHPDDVARGKMKWREALRTGQPLHLELRLRRADGVYRWFQVDRVPLRDERGTVIKWYSAGFDIEDQKRAESALQRSEVYLAEAQKLSLTGSFGWEIATANVFWSDETYKIMGFDRTVTPTIDLMLDRTHPDDRDLLLREIARARQGELNSDYEHRLLMPDGQIKHLHVRSHRVQYHCSKEEMVGALMDVTQARNAQEALHTAQAELVHAGRVATLGEISASIAHEVNQPLAAIVSNGEACLRFLNEDAPDLDDLRGTVEWIVKDGNRAGDVLRRVRALSKKSDAHVAALDVNDAINDVVALLQRELMAHRVLLRLDLAPRLSPVLADRIQLQQVLINLLMNGIEAIQAAGHQARNLEVRSQQDDAGRIVVAVHDSGSGITPETEARLFQPFFTTKPGGLGIGLSICRSIIEVHGGRLWARSNADRGATFQFELPSLQEAA